MTQSFECFPEWLERQLNESYIKGEENKEKEIMKAFFKNGISIEQMALDLKMSPDEIKKILES